MRQFSVTELVKLPPEEVAVLAEESGLVEQSSLVEEFVRSPSEGLLKEVVVHLIWKLIPAELRSKSFPAASPPSRVDEDVVEWLVTSMHLVPLPKEDSPYYMRPRTRLAATFRLLYLGCSTFELEEALCRAGFKRWKGAYNSSQYVYTHFSEYSPQLLGVRKGGGQIVYRRVGANRPGSILTLWHRGHKKWLSTVPYEEW